MQAPSNTSGNHSFVTWAPLLLAALGIPLLLKLIPPNGLYGFRTEASLASETVWYSVNMQAGAALLFFGCIGTVINIYIARSKTLSQIQKQFFPLGILVAVVILMVIVGASAS